MNKWTSILLLSASNFIFASATWAFDNKTSSGNRPHTQVHTLELKSISNFDEQYQIAKVHFLPDYKKEFVNHDEIAYDYNRGDCNHKESLFTTSNCSYPKALVADSKCMFLSGYYKECACLPSFSLNHCPAPKIPSSAPCEGKFENCLCPATVELDRPNDICTQECDGKCIAKTCTPKVSENNCLYGTLKEEDGCGGNRDICKTCAPSANETGCNYGTYSCPNNCGGTRTCCNPRPACVPQKSDDNCVLGYETVNDGCGGERRACMSCSSWGYYDSSPSDCGSYESCTDNRGTHYACTSCADECYIPVRRWGTNFSDCYDHTTLFPSHATNYYTCPRTDGTRYRIISCETGYINCEDRYCVSEQVYEYNGCG